MNDDGKISKVGYDFMKIKDISDSLKNQSVDFVAVIVNVQEREMLKSRKFRK